MTDFIRVTDIKESLTKCPICTEHFNDTSYLPRRMPCCVQCICQPCLQKLYNARSKNLACPLCRHRHHLPNGVTSLPTEPLILKILDHLKIQKGLRLPCTDCPDKNEAIARCDDCCVFLCEECHRAHVRHRYSRDHQTVTFEEMKGRPVQSFRRLHQCTEHKQEKQFYCFTCNKVICVSCTVVEHDKSKGHNVVSVDEAHQDKATFTHGVLTKLDGKAGELTKSLQELNEKKENIQISRQKATEDVNQTFDNLIEILQNRRAILLSDIEDKSNTDLKLTEQALDSISTLLTKVKSSVEYTREMRGRADKIEDLQLMVSSADSLNTMLKESPQDVEFDRTGVSFVPDQVKQVKLLMEILGVVRTVTFTPTPRPEYAVDAKFYNTIMQDPTEIPQELTLWEPFLSLAEVYRNLLSYEWIIGRKSTQHTVPNLDMVISKDGEIVCPHMEWDSNTATNDVTISGSVITNVTPNSPQPNTGCRIQAWRHVLTSRPLVIWREQRVMYQVKVRFSLKQVIQENKMIFGSALTSSPVDSHWNQPTGLSVSVVSCTTHKQQLCLWVKYDGKLLTHVPIIRNQVGESRDLHLCFLLDRDTNKIHVVDVDNVKVIKSVTDVVFYRPLWVLMNVDAHFQSDMRGELVSGQDVTVTHAIKKLLSSLR